MKTKRKTFKRREKTPIITNKQASNSLFITLAAGVIIGHYLTKNPDLIDVIVRLHKEHRPKLFAELKTLRGKK